MRSCSGTIQRLLATASVVAVALASSQSRGASDSFIHPDPFLRSALSTPEIHEFDSFVPGPVSAGSSLGSLTLDYSPSAFSMVVSDTFPGVSGAQSLGAESEDGGFVVGDSFELSFDRPVQGVGLVVVLEESILSTGQFVLTSGSSVSAPSSTFPYAATPGHRAHFIGLVDTAGFTSATFSSTAAGDFPFNVDDVALIDTVFVPELGSARMQLLTLVLLSGAWRVSRVGSCGTQCHRSPRR